MTDDITIEEAEDDLRLQRRSEAKGSGPIQVLGGSTSRDLGNWTPETLAERKAQNLCALAHGWCLVHDAKDGIDHYLATRPAADNGHNPQTGIAYND